MSVDAVAEQIAEWESNLSEISVSEEKYEQIKVELRQNDLPRAAKAEFIEYDPERREVEVTDSSAEFNAMIMVSKLVERPES